MSACRLSDGLELWSFGSLVILDLWSLRNSQEGRFYERNQYLLRSADRAVHDPAAALDAQAETREHRVSLTEDVPSVRIDHIPTQSSLPGVWSGQRLEAVSVMAEKRISAVVVVFRCFRFMFVFMFMPFAR
jgi:hypothetical protein